MAFMTAGLLSGWIMGLFGFKGVVIAGMAQLFGITLNTLGYYFLFAMIGLINGFIFKFKRGGEQTIKFDLKEYLGKDNKKK